MIKIKSSTEVPQKPLDEHVAEPLAAPVENAAVMNPEAFREEWERRRKRWMERSFRGAALFSGVYSFPPNLLDTQDPRNDPKYLQLLSAVLGMDDLEGYFCISDPDQDEKNKA